MTEERRCRVCQTLIPRKIWSKKDRGIYCSRACSGKSRRTILRVLRRCLFCGKEFVFRAKKRHKGLYCSPACKWESQLSRPVIPCVQCGAMFTAKVGARGRRQRFCSRRCANVAHAYNPFRSVSSLQYWGRIRHYAWSVNYPACLDCGTDKIPHLAKGKCRTCYQISWRRQHNPFPSRSIEPIPDVWPYISVGLSLTQDDPVIVVNRVLPTTLPEDVRAEAAQDMLLAILEGKLALDDADRAVPDFVRKAWKALREKYGVLSLDRPLSGAEGLRLSDTLAAP